MSNQGDKQQGPYRTLASIEEQDAGDIEASKAPSLYEMARMLAVSYEPGRKSMFVAFLNFVVSYTVLFFEKSNQLKVGPACARLDAYNTLRLFDKHIPNNHIFKKTDLYGKIRAKLAYFERNEETLKEAADQESKMIQAFLVS